MPNLQPELKDILECFILCDSQVRASFSGIYALDWSVIIEVARTKEIEINEEFYNLLRTFEDTMITEINKDRKDKGKDDRG